jgi:hypothetical protein
MNNEVLKINELKVVSVKVIEEEKESKLGTVQNDVHQLTLKNKEECITVTIKQADPFDGISSGTVFDLSLGNNQSKLEDHDEVKLKVDDNVIKVKPRGNETRTEP